MTDVSAGFRPPCWCPSRWAPTWHLHTNLYKFGKNVSPYIIHKKNCCDLNNGKSLCISTFFLFPDSGRNLLNDFDFFILIYFEWRDTENQQYSHVAPRIIIIQLSPEGEVNSGGYIPRREASRLTSTALHRP